VGRHKDQTNGGVSYCIPCECGWAFNGNPDRMKYIMSLHAKKCDKFSAIDVPKGLEKVISNFSQRKDG
jgi:hypothetical protein